MQAARYGAVLATVALYGNRALDIVVIPGVPITFESEEVPDGARDDGNLSGPSKSPSSTATSGTTIPSLSTRPRQDPSIAIAQPGLECFGCAHRWL
jgi:hypothetical protein